jgi:hypothetical protein
MEMAKVKHQRWRWPRWNIGGGGRSGRMEVAEMAEAEAEAVEAEAVEAEGCIGGGGMYQRHWYASKEYRGGQS